MIIAIGKAESGRDQWQIGRPRKTVKQLERRMLNGPVSVSMRTVGEWSVQTSRIYPNPFADVAVEGVFTSPSGIQRVVPAFFDGNNVWRLRFNPAEAGRWQIELRSIPANAEFASTASFVVEPGDARGFLRAVPGKFWGFEYENGEPYFPFGDTVYDLFGMDYCGGDVAGFLSRRAQQGFNLLRVRFCSSKFHPPDADFEWQNRSMWAWGGSPTAPRFDRVNLDWFQSIDRTISLAEAKGIGLELIMEGWGFEFPFNHRTAFTTEWEQLWMRYLIARYDAFNCVYFWTPLNEYEYYPNGDWHWKPVADRYAICVSRWLKAVAPHGHIISAHNGPILPPFAERFAADPEAVDSIMYQSWGSRARDDGWLAIGIDESISAAFAGWTGAAILAEWGYERNPTFKNKIPAHEYCDRSHSRRGAWRAVTQTMGIIYGQENSWGPWMLLESDLPGVQDLLVLRDFLTEDLPFHQLEKAPDLVRGEYPAGYRPLALRSHTRDTAAIYFPAGGTAEVDSSSGTARWFDPLTGAYQPASGRAGQFTAPSGTDDKGRPLDYVLVLRA